MKNGEVEGRVGLEATNEDILDAYAPEIERLKEQGGVCNGRCD